MPPKPTPNPRGRLEKACQAQQVPINAQVMMDRALGGAIAEAERELRKVRIELARLAELTKRKAALEQFLKHAKVLQQATVATPAIQRDPAAPDVEPPEPAEKSPLWSSIVAVLARHLRPMTAPEITTGLQADGISFQTENAVEIVRSAMVRRPDIFEKVDTGQYALATWPADRKKSLFATVIEAVLKADEPKKPD